MSRADAYREAILDAADATGVPASLIAAIGDHESIGWMPLYVLPPTAGGKPGADGHGWGPLQVDDRYHKEICDRWKAGTCTVAEMILYGAKVLRSAMAEVAQARADLDPDLQLRAAIARYNASLTSVLRGLNETGDPDRHTTGGNYSADVQRREQKYAAAGWPGFGTVMDKPTSWGGT